MTQVCEDGRERLSPGRLAGRNVVALGAHMNKATPSLLTKQMATRKCKAHCTGHIFECNAAEKRGSCGLGGGTWRDTGFAPHSDLVLENSFQKFLAAELKVC